MSTKHISIIKNKEDNFLPSLEVLKVISYGETLSLCSSQEVLHNWVGIVSKRYFDRAFEAMKIAIIARSLISLVLFHQRNKVLGGPAFGLEVIVV